MAKKAAKTEEVTLSTPSEVVVIPKKVVPTPLSVDFGREDLNTVGKKVNEIIDFLSNEMK